MNIRFYIAFALSFLSYLAAQSQSEGSPASKKNTGTYSLKMGDENFNLYKYKEAVAFYLEAYKTNDSKKVYITQQISRCYRSLVDYKNALIWYTKANEFASDNPAESTLEYAYLLKNNKEYDKAVLIYKQYCKKAGKDDLLAEAFEADCHWAKKNEGLLSKYDVRATSIETGGKHMGMDLYNLGLMISAPISKNYEDKTVYYNLAYVKKNDSVNFAIPAKITGDLKSVYYEAGPCLTPDGQTLYYCKNSSDASVYNPKKISRYSISKTGVSNMYIYKSINHNGAWSEGRVLSFNNVEYSCIFPCMSKDGKTIYFSSNMPSGYGGYDLYKASLINDTIFSAPENMGAEVNTSEDDLYPKVENNHFYYSTRGKTGFGGLDIQVGDLVNNTVINIKNMGIPFNSSKDDFSMVFTGTEKEGYFASNREGDHGGDKIFYFKRKVFLDTLRGSVIDQITSHIIDDVKVDLYLHGDDGDKTLVQTMNTGKTKVWKFVVDGEKTYSIVFTTPDYDNQEFTVPPLESNAKPSRKEVVSKLNPLKMAPTVKKNNIVKIDNIYFDFGKATIREESFVILDNICQFLKERPDAKIELSAHTDAVGNDKDNLKLSEQRANSCYNYLIYKGVNAESLIPKGYGESKLLNNCKNAKKCSEEENRINRRVEVKFL
jgi:outer membrane protein OmpA-like peptidoglycan-associated protein/tetratricopeptide (TPR) repeat protein